MMQTLKIMLISADDSMANSIYTCLTASGYKVIHILRGVGAIGFIHAEKPALIVLDIELPDFNSLAIIRSIRSNGIDDKIPVILIGSNMKEEELIYACSSPFTLGYL
jgi:DNA-binding response OmpR family regulator